MFDMEPRTKSVFGFDKSEAVGQAHVEVHAKAFPGLMDSVIQMLGPDVEFIEEILTQGTTTINKLLSLAGCHTSLTRFLLVFLLVRSTLHFLLSWQETQGHECQSSLFSIHGQGPH